MKVSVRRFVAVWKWARSASEVALSFGITRKAVYDWAARARALGHELPELPWEEPRWFVRRFASWDQTVRFVLAYIDGPASLLRLGLTPQVARDVAEWLTAVGVKHLPQSAARWSDPERN